LANNLQARTQTFAKIVPLSKADYISVCSWRLRQKRGEGSTPHLLNHRLELSEERILSSEFDVAVLTPRRLTHPTLYMASQWHGKAWDDAFKVFSSGFLKPKGIKLPKWEQGEDLKRAIYENHFICAGGLYHDYVGDCLKPAIDFVLSDKVFYADSGYIHKKRNIQEVKEYQKASGRQDWPIAPFILERLFSIWINDKNLNVINL